jgi:hypothetical protein
MLGVIEDSEVRAVHQQDARAGSLSICEVGRRWW